MTLPEFRDWVQMVRCGDTNDATWCAQRRALAESFRPHDAELADLMLRHVEANEAIQAHLARMVS